MDAERYMNEIVDPTISEFEANPSSQRRAFLACLVTCHTVDYLSQPRKPGNLRKQFQEESRDFATIDRVGHTLKHTKSGDDRSSTCPLKTEEVITRPPAFYGHAAIGLSQYGDSDGGVTIDNEREQDLLEVVKRAAGYLRTKIV